MKKLLKSLPIWVGFFVLLTFFQNGELVSWMLDAGCWMLVSWKGRFVFGGGIQ
jgi:hypothetical protein